MPIYEFACPRCRKIFSFLSRRLNPEGNPACPKCGTRNMVKQISSFATPRRQEGTPAKNLPGSGVDEATPDLEDPRVLRAMNEIERDMGHLDENNPKHMAHLMRKMQNFMPPGSMPREMDQAIRRLEAGEDPEKIEEDMGEVFKEFLGDQELGEGEDRETGAFEHDTGLYDY